LYIQNWKQEELLCIWIFLHPPPLHQVPLTFSVICYWLFFFFFLVLKVTTNYMASSAPQVITCKGESGYYFLLLLFLFYFHYLFYNEIYVWLYLLPWLCPMWLTKNKQNSCSGMGSWRGIGNGGSGSQSSPTIRD
jgi:hypothetical protein